MNKKHKIKNTKLKINFILLLCIIASTLFLSIGYAGINSIVLDINSTASASAQSGVFITDVKLVDSKNINNADIINIYNTMLQTNIGLSANTTDTYVKYEITVYNSTNDFYCFSEANYDGLYTNSNIEFELESIQKGDFVNAGKYKTFYITFKYNTTTVPTLNTLESYIDFVFKKAYKVTYENITNNNYPSYVFAGENLTVSFSTLANPIEVKVNGSVLSSSKYTYSNYKLTITKPSGDVHIRMLKKYTIKNLVKNGSFENGLSNWNIVGDSGSWLYTTIFHFGSAAYYRIPSEHGWNYLTQSIYWTNQHKYYYFAHTICTTNQTFVCDISTKGGTISVTAVPNAYKKGSVVYTADFTGNNNISINFFKTTGNVIVDGIGVVDLTEAFGSGNEPNKTWCDSNITYFDSSTTVYK